MSQKSDWFGRSPASDQPSAAEKLEDAACRAALKQVGASVLGVTRAAGLPVHGRLRFAHLADYADFPVRPVVTGMASDTLTQLMYNFQRSNLWEAWVIAWDETPTIPSKRFLVYRGEGSSPWIARTAPLEKPNRPYVLVGHSVGTLLILERFIPWCREIPWDGGEFRYHGPRQNADC